MRIAQDPQPYRAAARETARAYHDKLDANVLLCRLRHGVNQAREQSEPGDVGHSF
jgi:hypothetical protein